MRGALQPGDLSGAGVFCVGFQRRRLTQASFVRFSSPLTFLSPYLSLLAPGLVVHARGSACVHELCSCGSGFVNT